jgi:hypothetical protein
MVRAVCREGRCTIEEEKVMNVSALISLMSVHGPPKLTSLSALTGIIV